MNTTYTQGKILTTGDAQCRHEYEQLRRAVKEGALVRLRNGIYADADALASNMIDIERLVPRGVLCLYSAFSHYKLSTLVPAAVCVAIHAKRKIKLPEYPIIDLYYWKKEYLEFGVVSQEIAGHTLLITDLERTVCDAIKYRHKIGLDVCGEVLENYLKFPNRNITLLYDYAQRLRVYNTLNKYLETRL